MLRRTWGPENHHARWVVYLSIHYATQAKDPLLSLVLIGILEAAFASFITPMKVAIDRAGKYEKLDYYGKTHVEKESDHSMGSWTEEDGPAVELMNYTLTPAQRGQADLMIDELFGHFERLFDSWYRHRYEAHYYPRREHPIEPSATLSEEANARH